MGCKTVRVSNKTLAIVCDRGGRKRRCTFCMNWATVLCDYPRGGKRTCDKPLCPDHADRVGENQDFCWNHEPLRQGKLL